MSPHFGHGLIQISKAPPCGPSLPDSSHTPAARNFCPLTKYCAISALSSAMALPSACSDFLSALVSLYDPQEGAHVSTASPAPSRHGSWWWWWWWCLLSCAYSNDESPSCFYVEYLPPHTLTLESCHICLFQLPRCQLLTSNKAQALLYNEYLMFSECLMH